MTTADLKRAFMDERPVRYNGITYQRVTAVIYRKTPDKTGLLVQGELLDKNGKKSIYNCENYKYLLDAPFKISARCCYLSLIHI